MLGLGCGDGKDEVRQPRACLSPTKPQSAPVPARYYQPLWFRLRIEMQRKPSVIARPSPSYAIQPFSQLAALPCCFICRSVLTVGVSCVCSAIPSPNLQNEICFVRNSLIGFACRATSVDRSSATAAPASDPTQILSCDRRLQANSKDQKPTVIDTCSTCPTVHSWHQEHRACAKAGFRCLPCP